MAASLSASLVLPMPPGPQSVSARARPTISASSAKSRSRPMKLFGSAGRLPIAVLGLMVGHAASRIRYDCYSIGRRRSLDDVNPDGLAVAQSAEVHDLGQGPPPLPRASIARDDHRERQRGAAARLDRKVGDPAPDRCPAAVR